MPIFSTFYLTELHFKLLLLFFATSKVLPWPCQITTGNHLQPIRPPLTALIFNNAEIHSSPDKRHLENISTNKVTLKIQGWSVNYRGWCFCYLLDKILFYNITSKYVFRNVFQQEVWRRKQDHLCYIKFPTRFCELDVEFHLVLVKCVISIDVRVSEEVRSDA